MSEIINNSFEQEEAFKRGAISRLVAKSIEHRLLEVPQESFEQKTRYALQTLYESLEQAFSDYPAEIGQLSADLTSNIYSSETDLVEVATKRVVDFLASNFSLDELEKRFQQGQVERQNWEVLNRLLTYGVYKNELHLHVPGIFIASPVELRRLFVEGMELLASRFGTDLGLGGINTVSARSWIIYQSQVALRKLGFEITEIDDDSKSARAEISRERLIELFGK